jgi:hypothetical protein
VGAGHWSGRGAGAALADLGHTAGTLARTGATAKELMARLGHASLHAAMGYQHVAHERDRKIADGLEAMIAEHRRADGRPPAEPPVARTLHAVDRLSVPVLPPAP